MTAQGPLAGVRVVELAGLGPGPFAAMVLADLGADVVRVERPGPRSPLERRGELLNRGRDSVALDLRSDGGREQAMALIERADVLVEGYRPGVMERLGLGPEVCLERNPRLVYGRVTGWGQDGPLAQRAGHDINYIGLTGVLAACARPGGAPQPPVNLVGDFGGGGMLLAVGVLAALVERAGSGRGQVVDAAMVDGASLLMTMLYGRLVDGDWDDGRPGENWLDGGAPFYDVYETSDGRWMAVGALEPAFFAELLRVLGIDAGSLPGQYDRAGWPGLRARLTEVFATRTRAQWTDTFADVDACVSPVLTMSEAGAHRHLRERGTLQPVPGGWSPAPAPRFGRTPASGPTTVDPSTVDAAIVLARWAAGPTGAP